MMKTGLYKISHLRKSGTTFFRKELKTASITLYEDILHEPEPDKAAERILLLFSDDRGAYKRTYRRRFEEFDQDATNILTQQFSLPTPIVLHDVAVSDGRTSLDFFERLSASFPNIRYFASDYNPSVYVLEKNALKVVISRTGRVLETVFPPFVFNKMKRDSIRHYPFNHIANLLIDRFFVDPLVLQYHTGRLGAREIILFAPSVLQKARTDGRLLLRQHDLLQPFEGSMNVIRAMNILNVSYFSDTQFVNIIQHIYDGLTDGGILITGSNQDAGTLVHGGLYQKSGKGFTKIYQSGDGSPIDHIILSFEWHCQ